LAPKSDAVASAIVLTLYVVLNTGFIIVKAMEIATKHHYLKFDENVSSQD
jgi:hypothetical protein